MPTFRSTRKAFLLCLGLALAATPALSQRAEISLEDGRMLARNAVLAGDLVLARDLARALLEADPDDRAALTVLAAVLPRLGDPDGGRRAGAQAFGLATSDAQRYEAARLTALAAASDDRYTAAQFWLRRAANNAPSNAAYAQNRADFQLMRQRNPWSGRVQLSFAPSDNVNGGTDDIYNVIDGVPVIGVLSPDALALSGFVGTADLKFARRLSLTDTHLTTLTGRLYARRVWLDDAAQAIAPDARNGDFASTRAELTLRHAIGLGDGVLGAEADLGALWFGGELDHSYTGLGLDWAAPASARLGYALSTSVQWQDATDSVARDNTVLGLGGMLGYRFDSGARLTARLSLGRTLSDNRNERGDSVLAQLSWYPARQVGPANVSLSLGASLADYPDYTFGFLAVPGGRQDERIFASVEAVFSDWSWAGFAPVVTLSGQTTDSNVSRFDRDEISVRFSFRSTF